MINKSMRNIKKIVVLAVAFTVFFVSACTKTSNDEKKQINGSQKTKTQAVSTNKSLKAPQGFNITRVSVKPSDKQLSRIKEQTAILNDIIYYPNCGEVGCNEDSATDSELLETTEYPDVRKSGLERTVHILNHPVKHIVKAPAYTKYFPNNKSPEIYVNGHDLRKYFADYCYADVPAHDMHIQYKNIKSDRVTVSYMCPGGYFTFDAVITEEVMFENTLNCRPNGKGGCAPRKKAVAKRNKAASPQKPLVDQKTVNEIQNFLAKIKRTLTK